MSAPFMHPRRIANCTKDWAAIGAYPVRVSDDRCDVGEALRQSIREREARKDKRSDHIGTVLFILTVVGCYGLLASGLL